MGDGESGGSHTASSNISSSLSSQHILQKSLRKVPLVEPPLVMLLGLSHSSPITPKRGAGRLPRGTALPRPARRGQMGHQKGPAKSRLTLGQLASPSVDLVLKIPSATPLLV